jgi:hypothetical protein
MRASRGPTVLVVLVLLGLLGPPASASARDAGLRAVVARDVAAEKRLDAAGRRLRPPSSKTYAAYVRFLRRIAIHSSRVDRTVTGVRRSYRAQRPQTAEAARGRTLLLRGHRDIASASHADAGTIHLGIRQMSRARTEGAYRRAYRRMLRGLERQEARYRRGGSRIVRGRRLIRNAPAPPPAATPTVPAPPGPGPALPAPPAAEPAAPAPSSPASPLPILPSLPPLLRA